MPKESPIINILTAKLNYDLARQIYKEYENRLKDAEYKIKNYKTYKVLEGDMKTVELLLALSIFNKRVIGNLEAVVKFYGTVNNLSGAETIQMGTYSLTGEEKNKILGVTISYELLMKKFSVPRTIMEYAETSDFLKKLIALKRDFYNDKNKGNKRESNKENNKEKSQEEGQNEIPF